MDLDVDVTGKRPRSEVVCRLGPGGPRQVSPVCKEVGERLGRLARNEEIQIDEVRRRRFLGGGHASFEHDDRQVLLERQSPDLADLRPRRESPPRLLSGSGPEKVSQVWRRAVRGTTVHADSQGATAAFDPQEGTPGVRVRRRRRSKERPDLGIGPQQLERPTA